MRWCFCYISSAYVCPQAYERQIDSLGRALKRGEVDGQDLAQERHSLLQRLRAAEQVLSSAAPCQAPSSCDR